MRLLSVIRSAALDALTLALPVHCSGCSMPGRGLCEGCRRALLPDPVRRRLADGTPVVAALRYEGRVREVMLAFKEHGRTDAAPALSLALHAAVATARDAAPAAQAVELAAVPATRQSRRRRGYDPVELVARRAGGRPARVLTLTADRGAQKRLGADERAANRAGSMGARGSLHGRSFLLIDDVLTTGATLGEAVRAIRVAGGTVIAAATIAWTPLRRTVGAARHDRVTFPAIDDSV